MQTESAYKAGDLIRIQLDPDGHDLRWEYDHLFGDWIDRGYGGEEVYASISATTFEPGDLLGWPKEPMGILIYTDAYGETMESWIPLESNPYYPKTKLPGFPYPKNEHYVPPCGCGADATYGANNNAHSHWCDKRITLQALGKL